MKIILFYFFPVSVIFSANDNLFSVPPAPELFENAVCRNAGFQEDTAYHIDATFAAKGFGYAPSIAAVKKKYTGRLKGTNKAVANLYDNKIIDTIVMLSGQGVKFVFYKQGKKSTLTEASFTSTLVILQKGIKIGLTKNQVLKKFPEMPMAMAGVDLWQIGNEERTQYFELIFKNNMLKAIKYYNPLD